MPTLPVVLGVHLLTSVASAIAAFVLKIIPTSLHPQTLHFSITSNICFLASSVLAVVWSPSEATTMLVALAMLLLTIFSIEYHAAQFLEWRQHITDDSFFMANGNAVVVSLAAYHLARRSGRDDAVANLIFSVVFLSLVVLNAVLYFAVRWKRMLWLPTALTILSVTLLVIAEAISKPYGTHFAAIFAVGALSPAIVTGVHGGVGMPTLEKLQIAFDRPVKRLVFVDLVCGVFHSVAALAVSIAVYLARRDSDSDVTTWYTATLLVLTSLLPLVVVGIAWLGFKV